MFMSDRPVQGLEIFRKRRFIMYNVRKWALPYKAPCFHILETDIIFGEKLSPNSITGFCKPLASLDILGQQSLRKPRASLDVVC